jgi:hypothetical protein
MLTTLERMSWLVVLLATTTFIAFIQPPGGTSEDHQVLVSDESHCALPAAPGTAEYRKCFMLIFFVLDGLSFGLSMGCVMLIVVLSMPRLQYRDNKIEAGRFWFLLLFTWLLLYLAVLTGVGAFLASGLAVHNKVGVVVWPLVPGLLLMGAGFISFIQRFRSLYPGWDAVWLGLFHRNAALKKVEEDVEVGQDFLKSKDYWEGAQKAFAAALAEHRQSGASVELMGVSGADSASAVQGLGHDRESFQTAVSEITPLLNDDEC